MSLDYREGGIILRIFRYKSKIIGSRIRAITAFHQSFLLF
ncbi:hypothetical protein HMPREF1145_1256 [Oribacterium parvum ACB8]|nr:hypothetical protein HMPREF1145_1256 [Oribacterium parvum ACB8]